jgi:sodium transport system permease protein
VRLRAEEALALFGGAFALFLVAGFVIPPSTVGLVCKQVAFLAIPAIVFVRARGLGVRAGLGITMPRPAALAGAVLIGASAWYLNLVIMVPLLDLLVQDPDRLHEIERHVAWARDPWIVRVLAIAIVPAICEELLVRGAVARALRPTAGISGAVIVSAILFALLHVSVVRMLPIALFGAVLAWGVVVTDSVVPGIVMHLLNNLITAVVLPEAPQILTALTDHPLPSIGLAGAATASGIALLWRSRVSLDQ